jgi:hypothetical protein
MNIWQLMCFLEEITLEGNVERIKNTRMLTKKILLVGSFRLKRTRVFTFERERQKEKRWYGCSRDGCGAKDSEKEPTSAFLALIKDYRLQFCCSGPHPT